MSDTTGNEEEDNRERNCPYCAERIKVAAVICKHCRSRVGILKRSDYSVTGSPERDLALFIGATKQPTTNTVAGKVSAASLHARLQEAEQKYGRNSLKFAALLECYANILLSQDPRSKDGSVMQSSARFIQNKVQQSRSETTPERKLKRRVSGISAAQEKHVLRMTILGASAFILLLAVYSCMPKSDGETTGIQMGLIGFSLFSIPLYFLPTIVAVVRMRPFVVPLAVLNLFLGWTFLGWVVALVWAFI